MFSKIKVVSFLIFSGFAAASTGQAATFNFGNSGSFPVDNNDGQDTISSGVPIDGVTLTLYGSLSTVPGVVGSSFDATADRRTVINQNVGAGVCGDNLLGSLGCTGQPLVDSGELLIFGFSQAVTVNSLEVFNNDQNDFVDFWFGDALDDLTYQYSDNLIGPPNRTQVVDNSSGNFSDVLFFGVSLRPQAASAGNGNGNGGQGNQRDQFRVDGINFTAPPISTVPLPAGGALLFTGLVGICALRRRKKSAN